MNVLIVEDQAMLRDSLARAIDAEEDMTVVAACSDARDSVGLVAEKDVDLVLMDVCTEHGASGIAAARKIREQAPEVKVVVMTGMPELTFQQQAKEAQVDSFVYKNVGTAELLAIMRSTMEGYCTYPKPQPGMMTGPSALTDEEMSILRLICQAKSRREVAAELHLSEGTVKRRIGEILAKTGYDSITRLAVHAVSMGYVVPNLSDD